MATNGNGVFKEGASEIETDMCIERPGVLDYTRSFSPSNMVVGILLGGKNWCFEGCEVSLAAKKGCGQSLDASLGSGVACVRPLRMENRRSFSLHRSGSDGTLIRPDLPLPCLLFIRRCRHASPDYTQALVRLNFSKCARVCHRISTSSSPDSSLHISSTCAIIVHFTLNS